MSKSVTPGRSQKTSRTGNSAEALTSTSLPVKASLPEKGSSSLPSIRLPIPQLRPPFAANMASMALFLSSAPLMMDHSTTYPALFVYSVRILRLPVTRPSILRSLKTKSSMKVPHHGPPQPVAPASHSIACLVSSSETSPPVGLPMILLPEDIPLITTAGPSLSLAPATRRTAVKRKTSTATPFPT